MTVNTFPARACRRARIVVVGGGFSGAISAVNIATLSDHALDLTVVNRQGPVGSGLAYGRQRPEYLLNVAAQNMSAFPDQPDHFLRWLRTHSEFDSTPDIQLRQRFIPRHFYGNYLCSITQNHLRNATKIADNAVDIEPQGAGCLVRLADGSTLAADHVILATGNEEPALPPGAEAITDHPSWVGNPWQDWAQRLPHQQANIVILGTGLTAVDAIVTLRALKWPHRFHVVSRHGQFPHAHFSAVDYPDFPPVDVDLAALGFDRLRTLVAQHCAIVRARNASPAVIVDKLRPHTQRIWAALSYHERITFMTEHLARWNILRHRMAPEIHAQITDYQRTGQLHVHTAGIEKLEASDTGVLVHFDNGQSLAGDLVINATGPATKFTETRSVLLQNLLRRGLVAPDAMDMGIRVDPDHTVLSRNGNRSPWLLALGPLLKGTYWESTAVPELRLQAKRVAETVLGHLSPTDDQRFSRLLAHP